MGKNYVCSDIHGMYGAYVEAKRGLKSRDHLYILGDAIDRGKDGIKIIKDMMKRKNITYLLGNHDQTFIEVIELLKSEGITEITEEDFQILNSFEDYKFKRPISDLSNQFNNIGMIDIYKIGFWVSDNGGYETLHEYFKLSENEREKIYNFLINSYVILPKEIGDNKFLFVHANPIVNNQMLDNIVNDNKGYRYSDLESSKVTPLLWCRGDDKKSIDSKLTERYGENPTREQREEFYKSFERFADEGFITIYGHTVDPDIVKMKDEYGNLMAIKIDTGSQTIDNPDKGLTVLNLENMEPVKKIKELRNGKVTVKEHKREINLSNFKSVFENVAVAIDSVHNLFKRASKKNETIVDELVEVQKELNEIEEEEEPTKVYKPESKVNKVKNTQMEMFELKIGDKITGSGLASDNREKGLNNNYNLDYYDFLEIAKIGVYNADGNLIDVIETSEMSAEELLDQYNNGSKVNFFVNGYNNLGEKFILGWLENFQYIGKYEGDFQYVEEGKNEKYQSNKKYDQNR